MNEPNKEMIDLLIKIYNIENKAFSLRGFNIEKLKTDIEKVINNINQKI